MKKPNLAAMTPEVAKAIEEMMAEQGEMFSLEKVNLAELARRTGLSRQKLRWNSQENRTPNMPGYATCACADSHRLRLTSGGR